MKRLFVFLLLAQSFAVFAQHEWWPVHPGHKLYFSMDTTLTHSSKDRIWGITLTDSNLVNSNKRYVFNRFLNYEHLPSKYNCEFSLISNPLGGYMDIKGDSFILYTDFLYPIIFRKYSEQGDSMFIPKTDGNSVEVTIKLKYKDFVNVFGTMDSVRIYTVKTHPNIGCYDSIILSKTFGLIRTPNIKLFDKFASNNSRNDIQTHEWNQTGTMLLAAHSHIPSFDLETLTFQDCFSFNVGDIRHLTELDERKEFSVPNSTPIKTKITNRIIIEKVIDKTEDTDSIVYAITRDIYESTENRTANNYEFSDTVWTQTISQSVMKQQHLLDTLFTGTIYFTDKIITAIRNNKYGVDGIEQLSTEHLLKHNDTCLNTDFDLQPSPNYLYIKNNGGPYFIANNHDVFSGTWSNYYERKLIYYSNSSGTWGTPYPFPLGLKKNHDITSNWVKVYPNPANDWIQVSTTIPAHLSIYDLQGRMVFEAMLSTNEKLTIPCNDWHAGVYYLNVVSENGTTYKKFIVSR